MSNSRAFIPGPKTKSSLEDVMDWEEGEEAEKTDYERKLEDFESVLGEMGSEGQILVKMQTGNGKEPMAHVGYFEPDEYSFGELVEYLKREHGGGLYRIYLRKNGVNVRNNLIRIASPIKKEGSNEMMVGSQNMGQVLELVDRLIKQNNQQILQAVGGGQSRKEWMEEMLLFQQILTPQIQKGSNGIEQIKESMELLQALGLQVGDREPSFMDALERLDPLIKKFAEDKPIKPERSNQNRKNQGTAMNNFMLKVGLQKMLAGAARGASPDIYAELVADSITADQASLLFADPGALKKIYSMCPGLEAYESWLLQVGQGIKEIMGIEPMASSSGDNDQQGGGDGKLTQGAGGGKNQKIDSAQ